jgi:NTE family protein
LSEKPPPEQRALVMQGGGALGAYEAGVFKAFYDKFIKPTGGAGFDIVAGTSIGAVNACLLVNQVANNKNSWLGSDKVLYDFWDRVSTPNPSSEPGWIPFSLWLNSEFFKATWEFASKARQGWNEVWKIWAEYFGLEGGDDDSYPPSPFHFFRPDKLGPLANGEAARSYYWSKSFLTFGTPNVLSPGIYQWDAKFFDLLSPGLFRFDNAPISKTIEGFWPKGQPIATSFGGKQPRLLLVGIDLENCATVTFDSHDHRKDESVATPKRESEYSEDRRDEQGRPVKYIIKYPDGIEMKHLMTSMSSHLKYQYPCLDAVAQNTGEVQKRHFWDGVYLSNTPLREVLQAHRDYWYYAKSAKKDIPKLKVYVVDLYPTVEKGVPTAPDEIIDRQYDVLFHDKTVYDEKVAHLTSDYLDLSRTLKDIAERAIAAVAAAASSSGSQDSKKKAQALEQELKTLLNKKARSKKRDGGDRHYDPDLLEGRFEVDVYRIERQEGEEETDISAKAFDFSRASIDALRAQGKSDADRQIAAGKIEW